MERSLITSHTPWNVSWASSNFYVASNGRSGVARFLVKNLNFRRSGQIRISGVHFSGTSFSEKATLGSSNWVSLTWNAKSANNDVTVEEGDLLSCEVAGWAERAPADPPGRRLRILFGPHRELGSGYRVPVTQDIYEHLHRTWHFPLSAILSKSCPTTVFSLPDEATDPTIYGISLRVKHLVAVIAHDSHSGTTHCLIGTRGKTSSLALRSLLFNAMKRAKVGPCFPTTLATYLLFFDFSSLDEFRGMNLDIINTAVNYMGLDPRLITSPRATASFDRSIVELTAAARGIVWMKNDLQAGRAFAAAIEQMNKTFQNSARSGDVRNACTQTRSLIEVARHRLERLATEIETNLQDVQILLQTTSCLMASKDNGLNYRAAEASIRVAEESKKVALLSRKDSTDMRIIAAVTLIFLPATFVATLFSTTFFNFQASQGASVVSKWVWLYWTVTAALTIIVLASWSVSSRIQDRRTAKKIRLESATGIADSDKL